MSKNKLNPLANISELFDKISTRERTLIFYAVPLLILFIAFMLIIEPMYVKNQTTEAKVTSLKSRVLSTQSSIQIMRQELGIDLNQTLNQQISSTQQQIERLQLTFESELNQLVQPKFMPMLLEQMIDQAKGLTLLELASIQPINIFAGEAGKDDIALYRHGIKLRFTGNYFDTQKFLEASEQLGWKLYWQQIDYQVDDYPNASVDINLFTLSTSEAFISVQ